MDNGRRKRKIKMNWNELFNKSTEFITQEERNEVKKKNKKTVLQFSMLVTAVFALYLSFFSVNSDIITGLIYAFSPIKNYKEISFSFFHSITYMIVGEIIVLPFILLMLFSRVDEYDPETVSGSAHWMTPEEYKKYNETKVKPELELPVDDPNWYSPNMILSENMVRAFDMYYTGFNDNIIIFGGSGAGKTRFFIKPNILTCATSIVTTDPSGENIASLGQVLADHGYVIKILNVHEMRYSNGYNPLEYVQNEKEIGDLIDCFISNTNKSEDGSGGDEFFENAERMLYAACICLLVNHIEKKSLKNFGTIVNLVNMSDVDENGGANKSQLDVIFEQLPKNALAYKFYRAFKQGSGRTTKSIIISCLARLQPFMYESVHNLTQYDELELDKVGDRKTALFFISPQEKGPYNFLVTMAYQQLFSTIYNKGEKQLAEGEGTTMKYHIRCYMEEYANLGGVIPRFPSKLSTMRKYGMSSVVILQDKQQIESMHPNNYLELIGNCDSKMFLGGGSPETQEWFSEKLLGMRTVVTSSVNGVNGDKKETKSYSKTRRNLMDSREIDTIPQEKCIVSTRNTSPKLDNKCDYLNHPLYKWTGDADKSRMFLYRKMTVYDNQNTRHKVNMLQAESDMLDYIKRTKISDAMTLNDKSISGDGIETEDDIPLSITIQIAVDKFASEIMKPVPVITMNHVSSHIVPHILYTVSEEYGDKEPLILLKGLKDKNYRGYVYTSETGNISRLLEKSQTAKYSAENQSGDDILVFDLNANNVIKFQEEINKMYEESVNDASYDIKTTKEIHIK